MSKKGNNQSNYPVKKSRKEASRADNNKSYVARNSGKAWGK